MAIYLIRHGETELNRARVLQPPGTPLSERGLEQARRLAGRLVRSGITRLLSSDLPRARMTADCLAAVTGLVVEEDALLQERNFGAARGTSYDDLTVDPFGPDFHPPGGESWEQFHARVDRAWQRLQSLAALGEGHLAVVTHGLVCHSLAARHLRMPAGAARPGADGPPLRFGNTALSIVVGPAPWRFELLGCTAHLDADVTDDGRALSGL